MNTNVIAITGPAGSGKSTLGEKLAKDLNNCVNIDADHIKHMIVGGFHKDDSPGGWSFSEWKLVGQSIGILAKNFKKLGYDVVINGYIDESAWINIEKEIQLTHKFVLLPDLDTVKARDTKRPGDQPMGKNVVEAHYKYFSESNFFKDFIFTDSSNEDVTTTCQRLLKQVSK